MKYVFLATALALATAGSAQKVSNKLVFQKGQKLQMTAKVNSTATTPMGDNTADATILRIFDVQDASSTSTTLEHKIKRVQFKIESMMGSQTFDSENPKDMSSNGGKVMSKAIKNKLTYTIDASGRITSLKKDDDNPNSSDKNENAGDPTTAVLSQMVEGMKVPVVGDRSDFAILPDYEVGKGDTWTDSTANNKIVYTLADITDNEILINFTQVENIHTSQNMMGMEINMNSTDKTTGHITLDRKTCIIKEKTGTTDSEGTLEAMGQNSPLSKKIVRSIVITQG